MAVTSQLKHILGSYRVTSSWKLESKSSSKLPEVGPEGFPKVLQSLQAPEHFSKLRSKNLLLTRKALSESIGPDQLIMQTTATLHEFDRILNTLVTRLREWYSLSAPEFVHALPHQKKFTTLVSEKTRSALLKETKTALDYSMGCELSKQDMTVLKQFASQVKTLYDQQEHLETYLDSLLQKHCPNCYALLGSLCSKFIMHCGSLKKLSQFPASTIQVLGAEKALFRHMKTGARCPKFGILFQHALVSGSRPYDQGKMARILADKISIAAKVDYFKGAFIGDTLRTQVEKKFEELKKKAPQRKPSHVQKSQSFQNHTDKKKNFSGKKPQNKKFGKGKPFPSKRRRR